MATPLVFDTNIGSGAVLVPANITIPDVIEEEEDIIIDTAASPLRSVFTNAVGWAGTDRAIYTTDTGVDVPIPDAFVINDNDLANYSAAIRLVDGVTILESQPFNREGASSNVTFYSGAAFIQYDPDDTDPDFQIEGPQDGARGGSGIPAWFTSITSNQINGSTAAFDTPMCWVVPPSWLSSTSGGYRWPAVRADGSYVTTYTGSVPDLRMGALLTLPPNFDVAGLITDLGKKIANSLLAKGAYVGDIREDPTPTLAVAMERGPTFRAMDEFNTNYGMFLGCDSSSTTTDDIGLDWRAILAELQVVTNNSVNNIAGGGGSITPTELYSASRAVSILQVRVNGVLLNPSNPNDDDGIPGVLSAEWDDTAARIDLNNCPNWMRAGQTVTIDAGARINGTVTVARQWTGFLLALPGEDPDYLRDKVLVTGATIEVGSPPDNVQQSITAAATLVGADIQPPLPDGVHIEHEVPNSLVHTSERASWLAVRYLERFGMVPRYPTGEPNKQSIICASALYKAARPYQLSAIDIGGLTDEAVIEMILALSGITDYSLIEPDVGWYTLHADARTKRGRPLDMLQEPFELGQLQPVHTKEGVLLMRQVQWGPALTAAWEYDTTDQDLARIISATGELEVVWNPAIEKYSTGQVKIPFLQVDGRHFVESVRHVWPERGVPVTRIRAMGGTRLGGTIQINPVATYRYTSIRETFGSVTNVIASFDASGSFDPDGSIASYAWSDNQTTTPEIATFTGPIATVRGDTSAWTGTWDVTLTVTDNDGLTHAVTITIPYENEDTGIVLPATYVAHTSGASASLDGDVTWNDQAGATCVSTGAKPADGTTAGVACYGFSNGVIKRTTDGCQSTLTTVYTLASGAAINYIMWDWRNSSVVWAASHDAQILISLNAGVTWTVYDQLRTKLGYAGAISGRRCLGAPAAGGVYWGGGTGTGYPLIAFDPVVGSHNWQPVLMTGDALTDFPADATMRIMDATAPGYAGGEEVIILEYASGGGASIQPIYSTSDPPGTVRSFTRATGLTAGLKNGRYVVGDNPLTTPVFHAAFGDRDVWDSTDGIAWTQKANVMPAGTTPNDALFMSDVLTGIDGLFGVYMIAVENAGGTDALLKSSDGITTVAVVRGTGGGSTAAPAGYKPKQISVGGSGSTVATSGDLARLGNDGQVSTFDGSSNWLNLGVASGAGTAEASQFLRLAASWVYLHDSGSGGDVYHSLDGFTWAATLSSDANRGVYGLDVSADGTLWAVKANSGAGTNATNGMLVYKSTDGGATWTLVYTDAGYGASSNTRPQVMHASCITADKWDANKIFIACNGSGAEPECIYSTNASSFTQRVTPSDDLPRGTGSEDAVQFVANGRLVYLESQASGNEGIFYSDDLADTWTEAVAFAGIGRSLGPYRPSWFNRMIATIDITASGNNEVWISDDNGSTWAEIGVGDTAVQANAIEYHAGSDTIYIAFEAGTDVAKITGAFGGTPVLSDITFNVAGSPGANSANFLALPR